MLFDPISIQNIDFPNRAVFQPMEGCDCKEDGTPGELTWEKYKTAAASGAGTVWFEACAVLPEGRTNPRQMMLTKENLPQFQALVKEMHTIAREKHGIRPILILQLTHSGRQSINPIIAYRHPLYEAKKPVTDDRIISDEELDRLSEAYAKSTLLAMEAGFDGVDVKSCHGYLIQEFLSAFSRPGKYGGSFENRTRLYRNCLKAAREALAGRGILSARLSVSDMIPKPYGFGTDEQGNPDLTEPDLLLRQMIQEGVSLLNVTLGNPYYNPHVNRPFKVGAYTPPESAETGLERFKYVTGTIKNAHKDLPIVASGMSYYRENMIDQGSEMIESGICDFAGFGRIILAYPEFYRDYKNGGIQKKKLCALCSKCTELMRGKCVSGCALHDEVYREIYRGMKK